MPRTISVGKTPKIQISAIGGDLSVVGWDGEDILIKGEEDELTIDRNNEEVSLSSTDDVSLRIPRDTSLTIESVGGDMALRGVMGSIEIKEVQSDLSIRDVGSSPSRIVPELGATRRLIMRSDVVLPHPDGPTSTVNLPVGAVNDSSFTATTSP